MTVQTANDRASQIKALEDVLRVQLTLYQQLSAEIERKRTAIRHAQLQSLQQACAAENVLIQRLAESEQRRIQLANLITQQNKANHTRAVTIAEISLMVDEPQRGRLMALGAQLHHALNEVRHESSIVRAAAEALSRHMSGVLQTVHSALSRAGIYGQRGSVTVGSSMPSIVDIKS